MNDLDSLNQNYFEALHQKFLHPKNTPDYRIYDPEHIKSTSFNVVYPTATAPREVLSELPWVDYAELEKRSDHFSKVAKGCHLWLKRLQAGIGSSLERKRYLEKMGLGSIESAKGVDLHAPLAKPVSIVELEFLRAIFEAKNGFYSHQTIHPIVSHETNAGVDRILEKLSTELKSTAGLGVENKTVQALLPCIDDGGKLTQERKAPGGHAIFAVETLVAAFRNEMRPQGNGTLIAAISNGEDLNSHPDPVIVGWIKENEIPITLVTTDKTAIDKKGGILGLFREPKGFFSLKVIETAQAERAGQLEFFEKMGIDRKSDEAPTFASTNLTLFNYGVLIPKIEKLVREIGEKRFFEIIAPDLILNRKHQNGKTFIQLEGAMGSTIMNLDRYWREHHREPLVHVVNVDQSRRMRFFTPVKSAFDFFWLYYVIGVDPQTYRLRDGFLPKIELEGDYYKDVQNVLDSFGEADCRELTSIKLSKPMNFGKSKLKGHVGDDWVPGEI